ncbi:V-set and immunoglobulin domain-containing protein 4 isoform X2 [Sceloporus undulatus]|uniref:V-set and immunoglobulin domain-containing protein 4 isoform X2 n=1 Tax=Sceloporus undulatus TaxID=8520 RepID=UPI001C4A9BEF|nr:V-set and immunoglobulin domain-containing protein 4 isoform X2 [Sceloporus undulatus]
MEMLLWLGLLMLVSIVSGKGVLDLSGKQVVNGTWRASVTLPCVYKPLDGFKESSVVWKCSLQDHGTRTLLHRDEGSEDQTILTTFKGRASVRKQPPGDVSLQIEKLEMTDAGIYTCSVTWEARNKTRINKERVITFKVLKVPVSKPVIQSSNGASPILPEGARASLTCLAQGSPPITYQWFKEVAGSNGQIVSNGAVLTFEHLKRSDTGRYYCVVRNRVRTRTERSDALQLTVGEGSTELNTLHPSAKEHTTGTQSPTLWPEFKEHTTAAQGAGTTQSTFGSHGKVSERQGPRTAALPLYIIILIAVLCVVLVLAILSVAFCRRRAKSDNTYKVSYNNNSMNVASGDERRGDASLGTCEGTYEEPNRNVENDYSEEPTKGSEYVAMGTKPENEYELLVNKMELEYEGTNAK